MHELALMAATEWAKAHGSKCHDPAEFGRCVAQVEFFRLQELVRLAKLGTGDAPAGATDETPKTAAFAGEVNTTASLNRGLTLRDLLDAGAIKLKPTKLGVEDEILRAAGFLPEQPGDSITEASGQRDLGLAARTDQSEGSPVDGAGVECQPLTPELEARMTSEVRGLISALNQFARSTKLIHEEIPIDAHFGKSIAFLLACCGFQFANTLALSLVRGIFSNGGREYISQLELDIKDLFREIDLDGRRFLAVALPDECKGQVLDGARAGDRQ